jgi:hypothetical protein
MFSAGSLTTTRQGGSRVEIRRWVLRCGVWYVAPAVRRLVSGQRLACLHAPLPSAHGIVRRGRARRPSAIPSRTKLSSRAMPLLLEIPIARARVVAEINGVAAMRSIAAGAREVDRRGATAARAASHAVSISNKSGSPCPASSAIPCRKAAIQRSSRHGVSALSARTPARGTEAPRRTVLVQRRTRAAPHRPRRTEQDRRCRGKTGERPLGPLHPSLVVEIRAGKPFGALRAPAVPRRRPCRCR